MRVAPGPAQIREVHDTSAPGVVETSHDVLPAPFERVGLLPRGGTAWVAWPIPRGVDVDHDAGDEDAGSVAFRRTSSVRSRIQMNLSLHDPDPWLSAPLTPEELRACEAADLLVACDDRSHDL